MGLRNRWTESGRDTCLEDHGEVVGNDYGKHPSGMARDRSYTVALSIDSSIIEPSSELLYLTFEVHQ